MSTSDAFRVRLSEEQVGRLIDELEARGIDVIVDAAHSFGQVPLALTDLQQSPASKNKVVVVVAEGEIVRGRQPQGTIGAVTLATGSQQAGVVPLILLFLVGLVLLAWVKPDGDRAGLTHRLDLRRAKGSPALVLPPRSKTRWVPRPRNW